LWLVWAALLFGGFLFGELNASQTHHIPAWCRMSSSIVLAGTAWIGALASINTAAARYATLIAIGMTLGLLGDLFNAGWIVADSQQGTLGGMISFGLGHIAYIAACLNLRRRASLLAVAPLRNSLIGWELFAVAGWFFVVWMGTKNLPLRLPALPYCLLLAGTAGLTTGLALQARSLIVLGLGGALFLISDLILAFPLFRESFYLSGDAVWLTYGPGQMLIVFSIPAAARLCGR
jgi:uncharacterized membrane protein YhhN